MTTPHKELLIQARDALYLRCGTNAEEEPIIAALQAAIDAPEPEIIGWATQHDEPMIFPTQEEALQYCDFGEEPIALVALKDQAPAKPLTDEQIEFDPDSDCDKTHHECEDFDICKAAGCCMGA